MNSREKKLQHAQMIRRLNDLVARSGVTPTELAREAGLHHDAVKRKLTFRDATLMKETTFQLLEKAADRLSGERAPTREALEGEMERVDSEIAKSIDELIQALVDAGVLTLDQLPEHLRDLIRRRRLLASLLGD